MDLNTLSLEFFSSIITSISFKIDNIVFIDSSIFNDTILEKLSSQSSNIFILINCLFLGITIFYIFNYSISYLINTNCEPPQIFIFKSIINISCANSSFWICEEIIKFFSLLTDFFCDLGSSITGQSITLSSFLYKIKIIFFSNLQEFNLLSFDGFLEFILIILLISIFISYIIRYIVCKLIIILSPFAFLSLINEKTSIFFKIWFRQFILLLFSQIILYIILILSFSFEFNSRDTISVCTIIAFLLLILKCQKNLLNYSDIKSNIQIIKRG